MGIAQNFCCLISWKIQWTYWWTWWFFMVIQKVQRKSVRLNGDLKVIFLHGDHMDHAGYSSFAVFYGDIYGLYGDIDQLLADTTRSHWLIFVCKKNRKWPKQRWGKAMKLKASWLSDTTSDSPGTCCVLPGADPWLAKVGLLEHVGKNHMFSIWWFP